MVSALDCYVGGLPFKSGILPLVKHACGEQRATTIQDVKRSADVALGVNLREHTSCMLIPSMNKAAHSSEEMLVVP